MRTLILLSMLLTMAGCGGDLKKVFGSDQAIATINNASTVQAYRLPPKSYYKKTIDEFTMSAGPVDVKKESSNELRGILLDSSIYGWDFAKGCMPDYGVRVHFASGADKVDVMFCFGCDILTVYHNGKPVGGEDFDDARPRLVRAVKTWFPDDEAIQELSVSK